jgi:GntR family transcriptional regulator / MocR family aminotransferase
MSPRSPQVRDLLIRIDGAARTTLGRQIEEQLREAIRAGHLGGGEPLPSTRALAEDLCVSRGVVARAYAQLAAEGFLVVRQGSNPQVARVPTQRSPTHAKAHPNGPRWRFDLRPERADLSQFPRRQWLRSLGRALHTVSDQELGHVDECGLPQLRAELSAYLGRVRGAEADPDRIIIAACPTHVLTLIASALVRQGHKQIAFENPGRLHQHALVQRTGIEPVGLRVDENGLVVDTLESSGVRCVIVSPAHQFPLGVELAGERRMQVLEWAERVDGIVVEDDNAEFFYDHPPGQCLQALAPERVVYIGSASKTLAPGLRLGWAILPSRLMEPVREALWASTLHQPSVDHLAFADFLARGEFDRHVRRMRTSYHRRRDLAVQTLAEEAPGLRIRGAAAGLQLVAELVCEVDEMNAQRRATSAGIAVETLTQNALPGYQGPRGLIVGFGVTPEPTIPHAIRALAHAVSTG